MGVLEGLLQILFLGGLQNSWLLFGRLKLIIEFMNYTTHWAQMCPGWQRVKPCLNFCPISPQPLRFCCCQSQ